jgi:lipopolysaccharide biosynthesis glycosyltransferase
LRLFELTDYDRVVYVDADALPLKSLDSLFTLPFDEPLAAPRAYWLAQPFWSSHLLLVKPSAELWNRVNRHFRSARENRYYDMDIINVEFGAEIRTLPADLTCLDSEWEDARRKGFFADPLEAYSRASVIHFSVLGKPWSYAPDEVRRRRPRAHPIFYQIRETWWRTREEIFKEAPARVRIPFAALKLLCRRVWVKKLADKFSRR